MKKTEIKKYVPMLKVEVAFWNKVEFLFFEGTEDKLQESLQYDYVYFPMYHRWILSNKIKDFKIAKVWENFLTREERIKNLTDEEKQQVRFFISQMKKNIWREPTDKEFEKMIFRAVNWYLPEEKEEKKQKESRLGDFGRKKTCLVIEKMRENKRKYWKYVI